MPYSPRATLRCSRNCCSPLAMLRCSRNSVARAAATPAFAQFVARTMDSTPDGRPLCATISSTPSSLRSPRGRAPGTCSPTSRPSVTRVPSSSPVRPSATQVTPQSQVPGTATDLADTALDLASSSARPRLPSRPTIAPARSAARACRCASKMPLRLAACLNKKNGRDRSRPLSSIPPLPGPDHFSNCSLDFGAAALTLGAEGPLDCLPAGAPGGMSSISEIGAASPWRVLTLMMRV